MNSYILFLYASFEDHEDLEFFCLEHFVQISESGVKYVIESLGNCIIIFDTDKEYSVLKKDLKKTLALEHVKFYFLFEKKSVFMAELPESLSSFIFKPGDTMKFTYSEDVVNQNYDLDEILEKIKNDGIESLSEDEKKFLEQFGK
jgi:hypothetical protein